MPGTAYTAKKGIYFRLTDAGEITGICGTEGAWAHTNSQVKGPHSDGTLESCVVLSSTEEANLLRNRARRAGNRGIFQVGITEV